MQYPASTPQDYLALLAPDWRRNAVLDLRQLILSEGPELQEGIAYGMLVFGSDRGRLFGLNAQKSYVSLYVGDASKIDADGALLKGRNVGKGCVRFSKSSPVADDRTREFVRRAIAMQRRGEDVGC